MGKHAKLFLWLGVAMFIATLIATVVVYVRGAEQTKARYEVQLERNAQLQHTLDKNEGALQACRKVNSDNALAAEQQKQQAKEAIERLASAEAAQKRWEEELKRASKQFPKGLDCPAYTAAFRQWLQESTTKGNH